VWGIQVNKGTEQRDLRISSPFEPFVTVDNIEVAQFIHLLLNNQEIRNVIDTITSKVVLILGRFSDDRKVVLDYLRDELRKHNYLPIMFDFEPSTHRTTVETIKTLAGMAQFVIVDLTDDYGPHRMPILGRPSRSCCRHTPKGQAAESWRRWALRHSVHGPRSNGTSVTPGL
jgi:hypothetical protein